VNPGDLLVVLDQAQQQAQLASDKAQLMEEETRSETAKTNWERYEYLAAQGASSQKQLDQYRTQYFTSVEQVNTARERVRATEANLSYSNLRSPAGGTVADVHVQVGDVIQQGQVFTTLVQNAELEARVEIPAVFSERVKLGLPVMLSAPGSDKVISTGAVDSIDPQVDATTQGLLVKAVFKNPTGQLRSGQRLRTRVLLDQTEQLSVPFAAVTQTSGQSFVFRLGTLAELKANPGKADLAKLSKAIDAGKLPANARFALQTPVMVGELENNLYPVSKGLSSNATVITTNLLNLKHGMPVQVQTGATPN
jgi:RND family efflux transporter MFP subunit